ncbi:T-cell immunoreceptor with Ig and ITIM domains-like [Heterodontus francisci]|uniref:T-cell immunoreceptor with Ig and ITIM domains-like n=1 Tax=Heterodontus francisci TaxID=7792 RepID=UPI00355AEFEA
MIKTVVIYLLIVTGVQTIELKTSGNVTVVKGGSVTLRCDSSDKGVKMVLVEWEKSSNKTKLAVYSKQSNGKNLKNQRITMDVDGQHSTITIKEALKSDKGWYSCIFHTYPNGKQEGKIYLDVRDEATNSTASANLAVYISVGVVLTVMVIGIIFILLHYFHQRKSRINIPNQINIILKNTSDTDNQNNKQQLNRLMVTSNDCEGIGDDYLSVSV